MEAPGADCVGGAAGRGVAAVSRSPTAGALLGVLIVLLVAVLVTPAHAATVDGHVARGPAWGMLAGAVMVLLSVLALIRHELARACRLPVARWRAQAVAACYVIGLLLLIGSASAAEVPIPDASVRYRAQLERAAGEQFGMGAPVARLAAQIHQESAWRTTARSKYAQGLSQFTPTTAAWLPQVCPEVGPPDPWDAGWSIRAVVCYDAWLHQRASGATPCDRWAMTLSAYNGGETARDREIRMAYEARDDPTRWFGQVERQRSRSAAAWQENRAYVRRILLTLEPAYLADGWPGTRVCP